MKVNFEKFAARHRAITARAERRFREEQQRYPELTVGMAVDAYAAAIRSVIERRDGTGIAAVYAASAAHLVLLFMPEKSGRKVAINRSQAIPFESDAVTQSQAGA